MTTTCGVGRRVAFPVVFAVLALMPSASYAALPSAACTLKQARAAVAAGTDVPASPAPCTLSLAQHILAAASQGACVPDTHIACIFDNRFEVAINFATAEMPKGTYGMAQAAPPLIADDGTTVNGALFWFFDKHNPEVLAKIVNGCALNGHWWLFYNAATNVAFTLAYVDTTTYFGAVYSNPLNQLALPVADTSNPLFTCP